MTLFSDPISTALQRYGACHRESHAAAAAAFLAFQRRAAAFTFMSVEVLLIWHWLLPPLPILTLLARECDQFVLIV